MKKHISGQIMILFRLVLIFCVATLFLMSSASAATFNISLDPNDWHEGTDAWQAPGTLTSVGGNLQGKMNSAHPGSGWHYRAVTNDTYNFQDATLQFKWKITGSSSYVQSYSGLIPVDDPHLVHYISQNGSDYKFTTHHSFYNSQQINYDTWLYTEVAYESTGISFTVSYGDYGSAGTIISQMNDRAWYTSYWDELSDAAFAFTIADNYSAAHAFQLAEVTLITPDPVPVPSTMFLFSGGLIMLSWISRFRKK